MSLYSYLNPANSGQIMTINTGNLFVFEVGPSVKFVSAIIDAIFKKKGGKFFVRKKMPNWGGRGSEGGLAKDHTFSGFFFVHPSLAMHF